MADSDLRLHSQVIANIPRNAERPNENGAGFSARPRRIWQFFEMLFATEEYKSA